MESLPGCCFVFLFLFCFAFEEFPLASKVVGDIGFALVLFFAFCFCFPY